MREWVDGLCYPHISQTLSAKSTQQLTGKTQTLSAGFHTSSGQILSWSHYCELITLKDDLARAFYEIESINNKALTFVGRQKRITIDNEHYYVDLIFYHRMLRCLVLIDLKIGKLTHADVGQMNFYLNYIKDQEMLEDENLPVGIILCTEPNRSKVFVEYALGGLSNKLFVSKYKLYLPTKSELEVEIQKESTRLSLMAKG